MLGQSVGWARLSETKLTKFLRRSEPEPSKVNYDKITEITFKIILIRCNFKS